MNYLSIYSKLFLKGKCIYWKSYNIVTMTRIIISINNTIILSRIYQWNVSKMSINYSSINVFIFYFICSIINKIHYNPVFLWYQNLVALAIKKSGISCLITFIFYFWVTWILSCVLQAWKLQEIILTSKIPCSEFVS